MANPNCPYCDEPQEINHDDGYGYSEDEIYQQQCGNCEKTFAYRTSIVLHYDTAEAPCLNGGEHQFKATFTCPVEYTRMECANCGETRKPTPAEMLEAQKYHEEIKLKVREKTDNAKRRNPTP